MAVVDARGLHGLSRKGCTGRFAWHHRLKDLIWRALSTANIPAAKEPFGLLRSNGKRLDGLRFIPWQNSRSVTWDVTVTDTVMQLYLSVTVVSSGGAAERKTAKCMPLAQTYKFIQ